MAEAEIKIIIDDSKVSVYRYAHRMRDISIQVLEVVYAAARREPPRSETDKGALTDLSDAINWLKKMEL